MGNYQSIHTGTQIDNKVDNTYTKTEIDNRLSNIYTKSQIDTQLDTIYTKAEVNNLLNNLNKINIYKTILSASNWTWYNDGSGTTQDLTDYENKWYWEKYASNTMADTILTTLSGLTPTATNYYNDSATSISMNIADSYTAKVTCYISCASDIDVTMRFETDDNGRVFLNDDLIVAITSCTWTANQTLHFKQGENKLVICYTEGTGGDGWVCDPKPSSLVGTSFIKMTAVPMGGYTQTVTATKIGNSANLTSNSILFGPKITETSWAALEGQRYLATMAVTSCNSSNQITIKTANNIKPTVNLTCYWLGYN